MKNPVFAYGTYANLQSAVEKGKVKYPTYCWLHDRLQYAFVNKNGGIELVGIPKLVGALDNELVLSELKDGVYLIKGQHRITENSEPIFLAASYIIAIVATSGLTKKVRRITVDDIEDYDVAGGIVTKNTKTVTTEYLEENHYVTEGYIDRVAEALRISLETELKGYVDSIISEQVAAILPEELDKILQPYTLDDIRSLFDAQSV